MSGVLILEDNDHKVFVLPCVLRRCDALCSGSLVLTCSREADVVYLEMKIGQRTVKRAFSSRRGLRRDLLNFISDDRLIDHIAQLIGNAFDVDLSDISSITDSEAVNKIYLTRTQ